MHIKEWFLDSFLILGGYALLLGLIGICLIGNKELYQGVDKVLEELWGDD